METSLLPVQPRKGTNCPSLMKAGESYPSESGRIRRNRANRRRCDKFGMRSVNGGAQVNVMVMVRQCPVYLTNGLGKLNNCAGSFQTAEINCIPLPVAHYLDIKLCGIFMIY